MSAHMKLLQSKYSFKLVLEEKIETIPIVNLPIKNPEKSLNEDKRTFLKVASIAGAGLVASQLLPKKAEALIMGSSPTTGVVGVKNSTNARINPATEETVSSLLKTSDLDFDGSGYLNVNVQATSASGSSSFSDSGEISRQALVDGDRHVQVDVLTMPAGSGSSFSDSGDVARSGLVDGDRHVQVDVLSSALPSSASTESTLQTISFGGVKYALRMATSGNYDYIGEASVGSATSSAVWRVKRVDNTTGIVITWAGTGTFNQVWDNYASLSYS